MWQQFITRVYSWTELCWPVWPSTYVTQKYVFFCPQTVLTCLSVAVQILIALVCLTLSPVSNLSNYFSLQILIFSSENKAHSFFPRKSHSETLMSSLLSSLGSPEKPCTGQQSSFLFLLSVRPVQGYFAEPFSINNNISVSTDLLEEWYLYGLPGTMWAEKGFSLKMLQFLLKTTGRDGEGMRIQQYGFLISTAAMWTVATNSELQQGFKLDVFQLSLNAYYLGSYWHALIKADWLPEVLSDLALLLSLLEPSY